MEESRAGKGGLGGPPWRWPCQDRGENSDTHRALPRWTGRFPDEVTGSLGILFANKRLSLKLGVIRKKDLRVRQDKPFFGKVGTMIFFTAKRIAFSPCTVCAILLVPNIAQTLDKRF